MFNVIQVLQISWHRSCMKYSSAKSVNRNHSLTIMWKLIESEISLEKEVMRNN